MGKEDTQFEGMDESIEALTDLLKADESESDLLKANSSESEDDEEEDDGEKGYNEQYMKKYMKRFMKENKDYMLKNMKGLGRMKKAVDLEVDNIENELPDAEAVLINGTDMFKASQELGEKFVNVLEGLIPQLQYITQLQKAQGSVIIEMAGQIDAIGSAPQPRKSVVNADEAPLTKAQPEQGTSLQKAAEFMKANSYSEVKRSVLKAFQETQSPQASVAISQLDMCGGDLTRLPKHTIDYIASLVAKG